MLNPNLKIQRQAVALILPVTLFFLLVALSFTRFFTVNRNLSIAATLDMLFSIPLLHFLLSKRSNNLKYSTALLFTIGLITAGFIIPKNNQFLLHEIKIWVVPVIEFCGIVFFIIQTKKTLLKHKESKNNAGDFYTVFKNISGELLPGRLASIVTAEVSAFYYGFFNWRKTIYDKKTFSYHKKSGIIALIGVFIFMILVETSVFHLLLAKWSVKVAWFVSGLSLYAAIQAFGIAKSICKRPIKINNHQLTIPYGILAETAIDLKDILSAERYDKRGVIGDNLRCLSPFKKIEEPDIILNLTSTYYIEGLYGSRKAFNQLLVNVDDKETFLEQMKLLLQGVNS